MYNDTTIFNPLQLIVAFYVETNHLADSAN